MILTPLLLSVALLAVANGANDNFKGVATLYGSATTSYRQALIWATAATVAGSSVSVVLASSLARSFSGKGLVPDEFLTVEMLAAVACSGAVTILVATRLGMPTSTTHALTGALVGAGLAGAGAGGVGWETLATKFAQPLLLSPVLAIGLTAVLYVILRATRRSLGVRRESCLCVGQESAAPAGLPLSGAVASVAAGPPMGVGLSVALEHSSECAARYGGRVLGVRAQTAVDAVHYLSAGAVCFARAVNDTPKIAALLLASAALGARLSALSLAFVALAMAVGGWLFSRRVAETMSKHITELNPGQGLTANLITAALVFGASRLGVPVSTTHVSCGAIFGIGLVNGRREWRTIARIFAAWVTTLPLGLVLGVAFFQLFQTL